MSSSVSEPRTQESIGLYVHIPFCETKCPYCDFNTYAGIEALIPGYVAALRTEIDLWGPLLDHPSVGTVFFGGGTPSYLPAEDIGSLLEAIGAGFDVDREAEITLETNPGDFTDEKLQRYRELGVNRLSIGVQSLDDRLLGLLGRRHSATEAIGAYRMALQAGFDNVSIDLMYGVPHQSLDDWGQTLTKAAALEPQHLSMYCLTLESGTPMDRWVRSGDMPGPDSDLAADMYLMAEETMQAGGYAHYEISNWARPGMESLHNLTYWKNQPYLGVGPGAHSYLAGHRFYNLKSPKEYVNRLEGFTPSLTLPLEGGEDKGPWAQVPVVKKVEPIDRRLEIAETMMLGLRLNEGIEIETFVRRFGETPADVYSDTLSELESAGLLEAANGAVRLTGRGRLLGNEVFSRFFDYAKATATA